MTGYGLTEGQYGPPFYGPRRTATMRHSIHRHVMALRASRAAAAARFGPPPPTSHGLGYPRGIGYCEGPAVGAPAGASVTQQQLVQVQAQGGDGLSQGGAEKKR